jgi:hypothetical protein
MNTLVMRAIYFQLLWWPTFSLALAAECETYKPHELRSETPRNCQCGSSLGKLKTYTPSGFKLYAVCELYDQGNPYPNHKEPKPINLEKMHAIDSHTIGNGIYYFKGASVISGIIKKGDEVNRGDLYFYPDNEGTKLTYPEIGFEDSEADRRFKTTNLSAAWTEKHWCAPATIKIKRMYDYDWDSEASGAYALDYEVLDVGKFKRCGHS